MRLMLLLPLPFIPLLAQDTPAVPGTAGWVGAGMLGVMLSWLMFKHLPDKDALIERLIKRSDDIIEKRDISQKEDQRETRREFREVLITIIGQNQNMVLQLIAGMKLKSEHSERVQDEDSGLQK